MNEYKNEIFEYLEFGSEAIIQNLSFNKCTFYDCRLSFRRNSAPEERTLLENLIFTNCTFNARGCSQSKIYLKNIHLENIKSPNDLLRITSTIFNKVKLKGKFDRISLSSNYDGMVYVDEDDQIVDVNENEVLILNQYTENEYKNIEWALDISEAEFKECDVHASIPANLIKRNPETQLLLKYDKVVNSKWKNIPNIQNSFTEFFCQIVLKAKKDRVIVASVRNKKDFEKELEAIKILREEGIGELD